MMDFYDLFFYLICCHIQKQTSALQEGSDKHAYLWITVDLRVKKIFEKKSLKFSCTLINLQGLHLNLIIKNQF